MTGHLPLIGPSSNHKTSVNTQAVIQSWTSEKIPFSYRTSHQLTDISYSRRKLPLGTTVVSFCLLHLDKLLIQSFFLKEQFLCMACLDTKVLLQSQNHPVFAFYLVHLERNNARRKFLWDPHTHCMKHTNFQKQCSVSFRITPALKLWLPKRKYISSVVFFSVLKKGSAFTRSRVSLVQS